MNFFEIMFARSLSGGSGGGGGGSAPVYQEGFHKTGAKWIDGKNIWYFAKRDVPLFTSSNNNLPWSDDFPEEISIDVVLSTEIYGFDSALNNITSGYKGKAAYFNTNFGLSVSNLEEGDEIWGVIAFFTADEYE